MDTINAEILTLTYGSIVRQLISDYEDVDEVNKQLDKMGYNIGQRLVDEFLARSKVQKCANFKEATERIRQAFKMFINVSTTVSDWNPDGSECIITLDDNPLAEFVELPEQLLSLRYNNMIAGTIRGALEMVNLEVECKVVREKTRGDDTDAIRLTLVSSATESYPFRDDD